MRRQHKVNRSGSSNWSAWSLRGLSLLAVFPALLVSGCQGGVGAKRAPVPKVLARPVPADRIRALDSGSGKIVRVDARLKFVVLDFSLTAVPQPGLRLEVVRDGAVVGELRVTGPASGTATVADLVSGEALGGDLARPKAP